MARMGMWVDALGALFVGVPSISSSGGANWISQNAQLLQFFRPFPATQGGGSSATSTSAAIAITFFLTFLPLSAALAYREWTRGTFGRRPFTKERASPQDAVVKNLAFAEA
jgi:hypothetical protein